MIACTLLFNRPDLLQMQVETMRRFCATEYRHVVGIHAPPKIEEYARKRLGDSVEWINVDDGRMDAKEALAMFFEKLPASDTTLFMECDVFPFRKFTVDPSGDDFTCRAWYGRQHQAWAVWRNGCKPSFDGRADYLIPSIPIKRDPDVPKEFDGLGYYVHPLSGGEIIAGDFWHYERAGMGPMPRHVVDGKDGFLWRLAARLNIQLGECFATIQREATPEELADHTAAVAAYKAGKPAPAPTAERRPCSGCGGERFAPPVTPGAQENLLTEHFSPN